MNVNIYDRTVASDSIYSDTQSIDDGSTCSQLFFGKIH